METKHTPGEWTIEEDAGRTFSDGEVDNGGFRIDAPGIEQLAYVWRDNKRWGSDEDFGAIEAEANARLIAAAPNLLEALNELLPEDWRDGVMDHMPGAAKARAAIAKATGEQS